MSTLFEKIITRELPAEIVYEDEHTIAFLDLYPVKKGHTLVVPKTVFANIFDGDADSLARMMIVAQKIAPAIMKVTGALGVNLHMNNGEAAGQDVPHAHLHVIPRFARGEVFTVPVHETYDEDERMALAENIKNALS